MSSRTREEIMARLCGEAGHVGFYYKNLITGEEYGCNEEDEFPSASVIKLPVMLCVLELAAAGKLSLSEKIKIRESDKMPLSGALTLFSGEPEADVETLCRLMISVSDNTAANVLMTRVGFPELGKSFRGMGLAVTRAERLFFDSRAAAEGRKNVFAPRELGLLLERLYRGEFVSGQVSRHAMEILLQQQFNHKINGFLSEEIPVAHKTGEDAGITNDVGIIFADEPFIVCFAGDRVDVPEYEILMRETAYRLYLEASRGENQ